MTHAIGDKHLWPVREQHSEHNLISLVDTTAPHFQHTARILQDMVGAGVEITAESIDIADKLGAYAHANTAKPLTLPAVHTVANIEGNLVYYIRRAQYIKIGTTKGIRRRMNGLMPDEILAVEPGDLVLEGRRIRQFTAYRARVALEYFYPAEPLIQHIISLRAKHGAPPADLPSLQTESPAWGNRIAAC